MIEFFLFLILLCNFAFFDYCNVFIPGIVEENVPKINAKTFDELCGEFLSTTIPYYEKIYDIFSKVVCISNNYNLLLFFLCLLICWFIIFLLATLFAKLIIFCLKFFCLYLKQMFKMIFKTIKGFVQVQRIIVCYKSFCCHCFNFKQFYFSNFKAKLFCYRFKKVNIDEFHFVV